MNILLIDVDGRLPNIALHKLAIWHERQGDEVTWNMPLYLNQADRVYISGILTRSWPKIQNLVGLRPDAVVGGTATWGFIDPLPQLPAEVEAVKARINYGVTTRGCIRSCPFCIVPQAEGSVRAVGDIYDIWDGKAKRVTLLDNNILAIPDHFEKITGQLAAERLIVDWNQGLDIRFVTIKVANLLKTLRIKRLRFAFDHPSLSELVIEKVALLRYARLPKDVFFYVLVGFNTTWDEDLARLNLLRRLGCRAYVMRHENTPDEKRYKELASWTNQIWTFVKYDFEQYLRMRGKSLDMGNT